MSASPDGIDARGRFDIRGTTDVPITADVRTGPDIPVTQDIPAGAEVPVSEAATVMLVRDTSDGRGPEVFMLRRTHSAVFGGGFYVFPGGRLDPADRGLAVDLLSEGLDDPMASALLGVDRGGLGYWMAAIRECFEEAGVLMALDDAAEVVRFDDPVVAERFSNYREQVHSGERSLTSICEAEGLRLNTGALHYVSHWITPVPSPRRFTTRFLVARAPHGQEPLHDNSETIASVWIRPADALDKLRAGEWEMMSPTWTNLGFLAMHDSADAVMAAAARVDRPSVVRPRIVTEANGRVVELLPGDPGYDEIEDREV